MNKIQKRRLGKSTAIALEILSKAIKNPGAPQKVYDHHDGGSGLRTVISYIQEVSKALNLDISIEMKGKNNYYVTSNYYGLVINKATGEFRAMTLEERRDLHEVKMG